MEISVDHDTSIAKTEGSLWPSFAVCLLSNIFAGMISTLMSVYLPVVVRELVNTTNEAEINNVSAYINALYLIGWAIGGFTWGLISDRIGRVRSLVLAIGSLGIFALATSIASTWEFVVVWRLLSGFAVGGILVITPTLLSEIWPAKTRSIVLGIDSIGFPVGIFSSGLMSSLVVEWRQGFLVGIIPIIISVVTIWAAKESQNWKASTVRFNGQSVKYNEEDKSNLFRGAVIFSSMLIGLWGMFSWIPTWVQSLLTAGEGQSQRGISMMILGGAGITGGFMSGWISNAIGVRKSMLVCFSGCIVVSVLLFGMNSTFSPIIYVELALLSIFFGISQGLLSIYIPQLFPFHIRGTATGFCFNIGRFITAAAVYFIGVLVIMAGGYSNALLTFASIFTIGFITLYFTKDQVKKI
ncbi:MAG: MFS transporter [Chryseolinea sp.]